LLKSVIFVLSFVFTTTVFAMNYPDSVAISKKSILPYSGPPQQSSRKSTLSFHLLGEAPLLGIGYKYKVLESENWDTEIGIGLGVVPKSDGVSLDQIPKKLAFSHSFFLLRKNDNFFKPIIGYSGIFYSGLFYKNKLYNYIPSPNIGLRLGKRDDMALGFSWYAHLYNKYTYELIGESKLTYSKSFKVLSIPAFNFQFSF
jgi:hypothetical protein